MNPHAIQFFIFLALLCLSSILSGSLYGLIGAAAPNTQVAQVMGPGIVMLFLLFGFSGFFLNVTSIPAWWIWIYYMSWFHYVFQALVVNEFSGATFVCAANSTGCVTSGNQIIADCGLANVVILGKCCDSAWNLFWIQ